MPPEEAYTRSPEGRGYDEKEEEEVEEGKDDGEEKSTTRRSQLSSLRKQLQEDEDDEDGLDVHVGVEVLCCAFSGDGEFFAVGASDGVVRVYSDTTRVRERTPPKAFSGR